MKNDTIVSVIIYYDFYHNDFDIVFLFFDENVRVWFIYAHFNIVVYSFLLDANIGTPLMFAPVVNG